VHIGGQTLGRATYEPGWKWSLHVGPGVKASRCSYIPPEPHDSWVVGDEEYVSLHLIGASAYAK
jgi:hypothetical protein